MFFIILLALLTFWIIIKLIPFTEEVVATAVVVATKKVIASNAAKTADFNVLEKKLQDPTWKAKADAFKAAGLLKTNFYKNCQEVVDEIDSWSIKQPPDDLVELRKSMDKEDSRN